MVLFPVYEAEAGLWDRIKDIYTAPEKVEELKDIYTDSMRQLEVQRQQLEGQLVEQRQALQSELEAQREQLEASQERAEELLSRQEELQRLNESYMQENELYKQESELYRQESELYRQQSEALAAQNAELLQRMEQIEADRRQWLRTLALTVGGLIALFLAYAASIRVWRYLVWRRQGRPEHGQAAEPGQLVVEHRIDEERGSS